VEAPKSRNAVTGAVPKSRHAAIQQIQQIAQIQQIQQTAQIQQIQQTAQIQQIAQIAQIPPVRPVRPIPSFSWSSRCCPSASAGRPTRCGSWHRCSRWAR
jgi:hypothetical protein